MKTAWTAPWRSLSVQTALILMCYSMVAAPFWVSLLEIPFLCKFFLFILFECVTLTYEYIIYWPLYGIWWQMWLTAIVKKKSVSHSTNHVWNRSICLYRMTAIVKKRVYLIQQKKSVSHSTNHVWNRSICLYRITKWSHELTTNQMHCNCHIYAQPVTTLVTSLYGEFPLSFCGYTFLQWLD